MAWLVLGVGVIAYVLTVMQRTTLGVAGLDAADRFQISPGALAMFVFIQVAVYVSAQIPAGLMVDRFGSRAMLVVSGALLVCGQLLLAFTASVPLAVPARVLVGTGDAIVFVAVLALIPRWFPADRVPLLTQLTTIFGQLGQILSAIPFAALLHAAGWSVAFSSAAAGSAFVVLLVLVVVRNAPGRTWTPSASVSVREVGAQLKAVWMRPGTRLGFFGHMGTQFSMMVFVLLWGVPYLVSAQGLLRGHRRHADDDLRDLHDLDRPGDRRADRAAPAAQVVAAARHHRGERDGLDRRACPARPGAVVAAGGPGRGAGRRRSRVGGRIRHRPHLEPEREPRRRAEHGQRRRLPRHPRRAGIDGSDPDGAWAGSRPEAFRVAWLVQYPVWAFAVVAVLVTRRKARRLDAATGVVPRRLREVIAGRSLNPVRRRSPGGSGRCVIQDSPSSSASCSKPAPPMATAPAVRPCRTRPKSDPENAKGRPGPRDPGR